MNNDEKFKYVNMYTDTLTILKDYSVSQNLAIFEGFYRSTVYAIINQIEY